MAKQFVLGNSIADVDRVFPDKKIRLVQLGDVKVCLVRFKDAFYAFEALCPHQMANLSEGMITPFGEVVCPLHHYRFDLNSGRVSNGNCRELRLFSAKLTESGLMIYL
nr:Rieske 2Fe-2S domain-containing protein [Cytophagales bacterium]